MSMNESSLLDFLKKKSLFSNSPINRSKRSRSKSRQSNNVARSTYNGYNGNGQYPQKQNMQSFQTTQKYQQPQSSYVQTSINNQRNYYSTPQPFNYEYVQPHYQKDQFSSKVDIQPVRANNSTLINPLHNSSFESARVESAHCLENLSIKIDSELQAINSKIEAFNTKVYRLLNSQFKNIQNRIYQMVEASFKETEKCIREYMKQKEEILTVELKKSKTMLERQAVKIQGMKEELQRPNWRKVAGEILSTELEHRVEEIIKASSKSEVGPWEFEDFSGKSLRKIEQQIKQIFRIKT